MAQHKEVNQMKVAILNTHGPNTGGGKCVYKSFEYFQRWCVDATLFDMSYKGFKSTKFNIKRIKPFPLPILRQCLNDLFFAPSKVPKGYDVYHITVQGNGAFLKHLGKNTVITVHDLIPILTKKSMPSIINWISKRSILYAKKAGIIIADSEHTKRDIQRYFKINSERIRVINLAIDHKILKPLGKRTYDSHKKIILHVGSEEQRKNVHLLIKAFYKILSNIPNAVLYRVGPKSNKISRMIESLGLSDKVKYFHDIPDTGLVKLYNEADVFVFPSSYEGFGVPPLEAMACGCPVISSVATSLAEVVGDGVLKLNNLTVEEIYKSLLFVLSNKDVAKRLSLAGIKQAKKFSWKKYSKQLYAVYEEIYENMNRKPF